MPVFLWILIPVAFWSFQNNVQENTMEIFVLLSFFFAIKAIHFELKIYQNLILAGVFIFLASFSKGVPGFFPLGIPFLYWIIYRRSGFLKMVINSMILLMVPAIIYALIILLPDARDSLSIYFFKRLLGRTTSAPTVDHRTWILVRLFMEILPLIIIVVVTWGIMKWRKIKFHLSKSYLKLSLFLGLIGISGSVPIMLTMVQKPFYFSPSLPFFGMAFAMFLAPGLADSINKIDPTKSGYKTFRVITMVFFVGVIVATGLQVGKVSRNKEVVHDMYLIADVVGKHTTIGVHENMWNQWDMQCYMVRYWNISWDYHADKKYNYYLLDRSISDQLDSSYQKVDLPTIKFDLYKQNQP